MKIMDGKSKAGAMEKVQVLYLAGTMRSGSTILGRLLGALPEAFHVGEIDHLTRAFSGADIRCECRELVPECGFWQAAVTQAFGTRSFPNFAALRATRDEYRLRTLPRLLLPRTAAQSRRLGEYLAALGALYAAVRDVSGAGVIVDGSKDPLYLYLLSQVPGVDLHVVHLVRDSRAVAFSQQRVKKDPDFLSRPAQLQRFSPRQTAWQWNAVTALLDAARHPRPLLLRYEDFVLDPSAAIARIWELTGRPLPPLGFLRSPSITLAPGHSCAGNPDRFQSEVRIKPDTEWQTKMPPRDRAVVTALTFPLLLRHGYLPTPKSAPDPAIQPASVL